MQDLRSAQTNARASRASRRKTALCLPALLLIAASQTFADSAPPPKDSAAAPAKPAAVAPAAKPRTSPRLGMARNVLFSEFNRDNGSLLLELNAETAQASSTTKTADNEPNAWSLGNVLLRFYEPGRDGSQLQTASIKTDDCLYTKTTRTAESAKPLEFDSSKFRVEGTGWNWNNAKEYDSIRVLHNVRATLKADARAGHERIDIFSERLEIIRFRAGPEQGRARFVFAGGVSAVMKNPGGEDILLYADTLVARLRNTDRSSPAGWLSPDKIKSAAAAAAAPNNNSAPPKKHDAMLSETLENIVLSGNVRILDANNREMTGDLSSYVHDTGVFTTTGNARLVDPEQRFTATGGQMLLRVKEEQIEVFRQPAPNPNAAPAASQFDPVRLQIPSIIEQEHSGRGHAIGGNFDGMTTLEGDRLTITKKPASTTVLIQGNARATDADFAMRANSVRITAPRTATAAAPKTPVATPASLADPVSPLGKISGKYEIRHVTAVGDVHATYEGRSMTCGQITFLSARELVTLEQNPVLTASGTQLSGAKIEMDIRRFGNRSARVFSSETNRAKVLFAPTSKKTPNPANALFASPTQITAGEIYLRETDRLGKEIALNCKNGVTLNGNGLKGRCNELDIDADVDAPQPKKQRGTLQEKAAPLAAIRKFTATGDVHIETDRYAAKAGMAVLHPNVALTENSPLEDNGLDGSAPQFLLLLPHKSSPNLRPRLTHTPAPTPKTKLAPNSGTPSAAKTRETPTHIEGDKMEIVGGAMRSRFFITNNVVLTSGALTVTCNNMAGSIAQEPKRPAPANRAAPPSPEFAPRLTKLTGRGSVHIREKDTEATGNSFEYQPAAQKLYLLGNPVVSGRGGIRMDGLEHIVFDQNAGSWQAIPASTPLPSEGISRPKITIPTSALKSPSRN